MISRPSFTVVVQSMQAMDITTTLASISRQLYPAGQVLVCGVAAEYRPSADAGVLYLAEVPWKQLQGDFVLCLQAGDILRDDALYQFASLINREVDAELIYADEERSNGTDAAPFFKPSWSPDYLETFNYIGRSACFRVEVANQIEQPLSHYDFVLQFTEVAERIHHVDQILVKCSPVDDECVVEANKVALEGRLKRTGRRGVVEVGNESGAFFRVRVEAANRPLVSIVIPTAGQIVAHDGDELDLILNCVSQIREKSSYTNVEVIVVDNGDLSSHQITMLDRLGCRRTTFVEPKFNVAKKLNLGADLASGDFLLLLNDDIEILSTDWIERLLEHFEKPHVGVVGPKLLYRDLTTQHVGVVLNSGNPDHVRRLFPRDDEGYFFSTCGVRNYSAVTGACMMTRRTVYQAVGGYSEELAVSYNDTDFCMKVGELGLSTVYTPYAELIHFESQSRVAKLDLDEAHWFQQTWAKRSTSDNYYNERFLSVASPTFGVEVNPRLL
ncbi:MAG: glycosyltransferase [Planctomycetota bacterium]